MFYRVKPLQWNVTKALIGWKLIAKDCFGNEFARLDVNSPDLLSNNQAKTFMHNKQLEYKAVILSTLEPKGKYTEGDLVRKPTGSWWEGKVVGMYSTDQTPEGYAVQLIGLNNAPVQIYPANALVPYNDMDPFPN